MNLNNRKKEANSNSTSLSLSHGLSCHSFMYSFTYLNVLAYIYFSDIFLYLFIFFSRFNAADENKRRKKNKKTQNPQENKIKNRQYTCIASTYERMAKTKGKREQCQYSEKYLQLLLLFFCSYSFHSTSSTYTYAVLYST